MKTVAEKNVRVALNFRRCVYMGHYMLFVTYRTREMHLVNAHADVFFNASGLCLLSDPLSTSNFVYASS